jgi:octaprenyl-diphosphate synthase
MSMEFAVLLEPIRAKLDALERAFASELSSDVPIIEEINTHLAKHAGKRVRPALLLLSSKLAGYKGDGDVNLGVVVEFIHTATLIHDDIIDNAELRRGQKAVNAIWGNNVTVLLGDWLYVKSMELALREGSLRLLDVLTNTTMTMVEGELIELDVSHDLAISREAYLDVVRRKTAWLFGACGRLAGILAGLDEEREEALFDYGLNVGFAFQLIDDMLDFVGDEQVLGKPVVNDLVEGKVTLPVILLLERASETETAVVRKIVETEQATPEEHAELVALMKQHGTLDATLQMAAEYGRRALKGLALFEDSAERRALEKVPDLLLSRNR